LSTCLTYRDQERVIEWDRRIESSECNREFSTPEYDALCSLVYKTLYSSLHDTCIINIELFTTDYLTYDVIDSSECIIIVERYGYDMTLPECLMIELTSDSIDTSEDTHVCLILSHEVSAHSVYK
jgi:hypothetical protein